MQEMRSWLAVVTILCFDSPGVTESDKQDSSESPGYKLASEMLRDTEVINFLGDGVVDPCVDFFEFTCGNWIAAHPIPSDESYRTQAHVLSDKVRKQMRGKSYGVWPMVDGDDKWRLEILNLTSLMIDVSKVRGVSVFIAYEVSKDWKNASRRIIQVKTVSNLLITLLWRKGIRMEDLLKFEDKNLRANCHKQI
ncbi:hypothetical protein COOONC_06080 [Cooperia oncophora]